ncbi:MAG: Type 1 glutamine amidotransferase-like domain-containing protein, partial [Chitinophagaceae bacterium]|nr:Type 1 glutamine amidotransferase-like domain-containing protein [Anaerolineae bacterium]
MKTTGLLFLMACAALLLATSAGIMLAQEEEGVFIPIGAGYGDTYEGVIEHIMAASKDDNINILVLASAYSTNSDEITEEERTQNTADAEERRLEIEDACTALAEGKTCVVTLAPIYTRVDALTPEAFALFSDDLDAIYILGGDQAIAMEILVGTPVEQAMTRIHASGTIITGTSAGNAVQSRTMIGGYVGDFG